ncbi:MAG: hypothetical protein ACRDU8_07010 [Egibacteraceae bacterium]
MRRPHPAATPNPDAWIAGLPESLAGHRAVLAAVLEGVRADATWRWLELGCSVARGAGDVDSDLDMALGADPDAWPAALERIDALTDRAGPVLDRLRHRLPGWGGIPHARVFVQHVSGVQLDLVVLPADRRPGRPPDTVVLHDRDGRLAEPWTPPSLTADAATVREWSFLGWLALADLAKYLRRRSPWEALERLGDARTHAWRLWAVAEGVPFPGFGITSLLDEAPDRLPDAAATTARLDLGELRAAALACADLLEQAGVRAAKATGVELPVALAESVRGRLSAHARPPAGAPGPD